jgi:antirestriction protein ArdC
VADGRKAWLERAAYISHWIRLLKSDTRAFFTACSKAQAAAAYLRGLALAEAPIEMEEAA